MLFEDMPTNFRLIQKCSKYVYSTKICYFYFQNSVSITRNQYSKRHNDLIKSSEKIISLLEKLQNDDDTNEGINSLLSAIEEGFLNKLALAKLS